MRTYSTLEAMRHVALATVSAAIIAGTPALADSGPAAATTQAQTKSPRINFLAAFEGFRKQIDEASKGIGDATGTLVGTSKITVDTKRADIGELREKMLGLSKQMESDGSLSQAIDQFDSWVAAQRKRIDIRRADFGNQRNVEDLLKTYDRYGKEISQARELVGSYKADVVAALQELTAGEALAAEFLLAEEAGKALETLNAALSTVRSTMEGIRYKLHELGLNSKTG